MAQLIKHGSELLERLASLSFERAARGLRGLAATVYLLFGTLGVMQIASPGALGRIASQPAGRILLGALAAVLVLPALVMLLDRATGRERGPLEPGASDALLHISVAIAGVELWLGDKLLTPSQHTVLLEVLGALLALVGLVLVVAGLVHGWRARGEARHRSVRLLQQRDALVRGVVSIVLSAFFANAALVGTQHVGAGYDAGPLTLPLLIATAVALLVYAGHNLWLSKIEDQLWSL